MPPKLYVDAPPHGDFRAMPASGGGLAILKWVTSFPGNPERGLPVVAGALLASSVETGELLAVLDCAAVTSLRTGAAAAVSARRSHARARAAPGSSAAASTGPGPAAAWPPSGFTDGVCCDVRPGAAEALAGELGWRAGDPRRGAGLRRRRDRHPGHRAGHRRRRPAARAAPGPARRRRPRQGRDDRRGDRALPPVLRPVGAGLDRRASWPGRSTAARSVAATSPTWARSSTARLPGAARPRRSRPSTRPAWRSRTSGSRWRCSRRSNSPRRGAIGRSHSRQE